MLKQLTVEGVDYEYTDERIFPSEVEAMAFVEGVEYVNDSAVSVIAIVEYDGERCRVLLYDEDAL